MKSKGTKKIRCSGYYGQKTKKPFNFIPDGIRLKLLLHKEDGFRAEHDIIVDNEMVKQFIHYDKSDNGCGSMAGLMAHY